MSYGKTKETVQIQLSARKAIYTILFLLEFYDTKEGT